jgi:hypothetical protein
MHDSNGRPKQHCACNFSQELAQNPLPKRNINCGRMIVILPPGCPNFRMTLITAQQPLGSIFLAISALLKKKNRCCSPKSREIGTAAGQPKRSETERVGLLIGRKTEEEVNFIRPVFVRCARHILELGKQQGLLGNI